MIQDTDYYACMSVVSQVLRMGNIKGTAHNSYVTSPIIQHAHIKRTI